MRYLLHDSLFVGELIRDLLLDSFVDRKFVHSLVKRKLWNSAPQNLNGTVEYVGTSNRKPPTPKARTGLDFSCSQQ